VPFTLAHPAAVLPLRGVRHLRTAPLMVGAMVPDLPYFLPGGITQYRPDTHAFVHSFSLDLLLGYASLAVLFLLRRPLTALLSMRARGLCLRALAPFARLSEWAFAAPAILIGVWTHLLWDSFTHRNGWVVHRMSALSAPLGLGTHNWTVYHALQYLSSVVGLCVLVLWYDRLPTPGVSTGAAAARSAAGPVLLLVVTAAVLIGGVQAVENFEHVHSIDRMLSVLLTDTVTWFAALYLTAGIVLTLEHGAQQLPGAGG
jgi:Domain of unknown function (DUF4184)